MSTAITDALWLDGSGHQRWLVIPDDVAPEADRATLDLEQLDGAWVSAAHAETTAMAAVTASLTASGWQRSGPWRDISLTRATATVTKTRP